jgi:hypothetical protein
MAAGLSGVGMVSLAVVFFGVLFFLVFMRKIESKRIENKFDRKNIIVSSYGVNYFGLSSERGGPARSSGILVLLRDGIFYRARFAKKELFIPGCSITSIRIVETHKGRPLYQKAVAIDFLSKEGKNDTAAFRIPYPDQWIGAIKNNLISGLKEK